MDLKRPRIYQRSNVGLVLLQEAGLWKSLFLVFGILQAEPITWLLWEHFIVYTVPVDSMDVHQCDLDD